MTGIDRFKEYEEELREKYGEASGRIVTVSGLSGVGKSTLARFLSNEMDLRLVSSGGYFREEARKRNMSIREFIENMDSIGQKEDVDFDLKFDRKVLEITFKGDDVVFEGRIAGVLLNDIADVKVLVTCDPETLAERVTQRENVPKDKALQRIKRRNKEDVERYKEKYGIDITEKDYYDVVVNNNGSLEESKEDILEKVSQELGE